MRNLIGQARSLENSRRRQRSTIEWKSCLKLVKTTSPASAWIVFAASRTSRRTLFVRCSSSRGSLSPLLPKKIPILIGSLIGGIDIQLNLISRHRLLSTFLSSLRDEISNVFSHLEALNLHRRTADSRSMNLRSNQAQEETLKSRIRTRSTRVPRLSRSSRRSRRIRIQILNTLNINSVAWPP